MAESNIAVKPKRRLHRRLVERFVITGKLRLTTPAHFGNGETDNFTDMPLMKDELDQNKPLLPGSSIAGALRSYLRERQLGYWQPPPPPPKDNSKKEEDRYKAEMKKERELAASLLFGGARGDDDGGQSPLIVHDALGVATAYELRDGVRIEPETRTAEDNKKYDTTLLAASSTFDLRFDLLIGLPEGCASRNDQKFKDHRMALLSTLATALDGLAKGEITLGARKRRGFGRCRVDEWTVRSHDLLDRKGLLAWLAEDRPGWVEAVKPKQDAQIKSALGANNLIDDNRRRFTMKATFALDGSLLVRSGTPDEGPDMVHLQSPRPDNNGRMVRRPILAGTSWAGVLRSRATQIVNTLAPQRQKQADDIIECIFGPEEIRTSDRNVKASRIEIAETDIHEFDETGKRIIKPLEQTRIKIDRFTGGAFESALFSEEPLFGSRDSRLTMELSLRLPKDQATQMQHAEIGLLLLLLKDLWTGDLPLGGEVSVGRGRLRGVQAEINYAGRKWGLEAGGDGLTITAGERAELEAFVAALKISLGKEPEIA